MTTFSRLELLQLNYIAKSKTPLFANAMNKVSKGDSLFKLEQAGLILKTRKGFIITNNGKEFLRLNQAQLQSRTIALSLEEIHCLEVSLTQTLAAFDPSNPIHPILSGILEKLSG